MANSSKASETSLLIQFHSAGGPLALEATEETGFRQLQRGGEYRWTRRRIIGGTSENLNGVRCMYLEANLLLDVDRVTCSTKYKQAPLVRFSESFSDPLVQDEYSSSGL